MWNGLDGGGGEVKQRPPPHTRTHPFFSHSVIFFFFFLFSFTFLSSRLLLAPWCMAFFLQWLFQSAARDVINFIHTLWMLCLEKKKKKKEMLPSPFSPSGEEAPASLSPTGRHSPYSLTKLLPLPLWWRSKRKTISLKAWIRKFTVFAA